jgi:hypothetical protein
MLKDFFSHLFEDYIYDFRRKPRDKSFSWIKFFRKFILLLLITMDAIPPPVVLFAQGEYTLMLRAVIHRTTKNVQDYYSHYEDQRKLIEAYGTEQSKPENTPAP